MPNSYLTLCSCLSMLAVLDCHKESRYGELEDLLSLCSTVKISIRFIVTIV